MKLKRKYSFVKTIHNVCFVLKKIVAVDTHKRKLIYFYQMKLFSVLKSKYFMQSMLMILF